MRNIDTTDKKITDAFCKLVSSIGYKRINIKLLAETAGINRSTFYEYYRNKRELAETVCNDFMDEYMTLVSDDFAHIDSPAFRESLKTSYSYLNENRQLLTALWQIGEDDLVPYRIMQRNYVKTIRRRTDSISDVSDFRKDLFSVSVAGSAMSANMLFIFGDYENDIDMFVDSVMKSLLQGDMSILKP